MPLFKELFDAGFLKDKELTELEKTGKTNGIKPGSVLPVLYNFFRDKLRGGPGFDGFLVVVNVPAGGQLIQNVHHRLAYLKFIEILYSNEVVSEIVYDKLKAFPSFEGKISNFFILHLAMELTSFYQNFGIGNQLEFARLLSGNNRFGTDGMFNKEEENQLLIDIRAGKLHTYLDFFKYSYGCRMVDFSEYSFKPGKLLHKLTKILNELCYSAFTITDIAFEEDDFVGDPEYHDKQALITLSTGGREHRHTYTFSMNEGNSEHSADLVLENLLDFVNILLADFNCSYRLSGITCNLNPQLFPESGVKYAICRFQSENINILDFYDMQKRFLSHRPLNLFIKFPLSYTHIEYTLYHFRQCGLFSHLNEEQFAFTISNIYHKTYSSIGGLIAVFPDTILLVNRTVSAGNKPYSDLLFALNRISQGILNFTEIKDEIPEHFTLETESTFKVSFTCNNRHHEVYYDLIGNEFNDKIIYYIINEILRVEYTDYQLIQFAGSDYRYDYYLFATNQQSDYLQKMKLRDSIDRF